MFEENQNTNERQTMSRVETAKFLGVCVGTLKKLDIPCAKVGRRLVYFRDSVNKWLYSQEEERKGKKRKQKPEADADAENNAENPKPEADDAESEADDAESEEKVEAVKTRLELSNQELKTFQAAENQKSKKDSERNKKIEYLKSLCFKIIGHNKNLLEQWDKWHFLEIEQVLKDGLPELTLLIEKLNAANCFEDIQLSLLKKELEREKKFIEEDVKDGISENELVELIKKLENLAKSLKKTTEELERRL